jgi:hypothetical protein
MGSNKVGSQVETIETMSHSQNIFLLLAAVQQIHWLRWMAQPEVLAMTFRSHKRAQSALSLSRCERFGSLHNESERD